MSVKVTRTQEILIQIPLSKSRLSGQHNKDNIPLTRMLICQKTIFLYVQIAGCKISVAIGLIFLITVNQAAGMVSHVRPV
jgi:hypothetical protein